MNYGKWFTLDLEASDLRHGINVFNYRGFKFYKKDAPKEFEKEEDGEQTTPEYPIFAVLNADGVHFCCHYALLSPSSKDEDSNNGKLPIYHQDNMILSLECSGNTHTSRDFHHRINDAFCAVYPRKNNPIEDGTGDAFFKQFKSQTLRGIGELEAEKGVTYSSLEVFRKQQIDEDWDVTEYTHFVVRKLFLDFLYDFEHTDVFQNSPHYDTVYSRFHEDLLFDAIAKKAEYYYQKKLCENVFCNTKDRFEDKNYLLANLENYVYAEHHWVECILNPQSDKLFYDSNWIISTKKELDNVYTSVNSCADLLEKIQMLYDDSETKIIELKQIIKSSAEQAHAWYIHKYDLGGSLHVLFGDRSPVLWLCLCIPPLFPIARKLLSKRSAIRMVGTIEMFLPRMFAAIFAAWFSLFSFVDRYISVWQNPISHQNHTSGWITLGIFATLLLMFTFLYSEIKRKTKYTFEDHKTELSKSTSFEGTILRRVLSIFVIGFEYSAITSIFIYNTTKLGGNLIQIIFSILIVMFIGIFVQMIFDDKSVSESFNQ